MKTIKKVSEVYTGGLEVVTSISSSSTNSQVPSAKAAYDSTSFKELTSPAWIWGLDEGTYKLPMGCAVRYGSSDDTESEITIESSSMLFVVNLSLTQKQFFIIAGSSITASQYRMYTGITTGKAKGSSHSFMAIKSNYLTGISSYVKNNLTTSTSSSSYALSAYQGYVLNNSKEDVSNKVTSLSSSSTDTEYPSAKAVYDATQDNYSTTEQVVGTWVDGKPLYEKTISFTAPNVR